MLLVIFSLDCFFAHLKPVLINTKNMPVLTKIPSMLSSHRFPVGLNQSSPTFNKLKESNGGINKPPTKKANTLGGFPDDPRLKLTTGINQIQSFKPSYRPVVPADIYSGNPNELPLRTPPKAVHEIKPFKNYHAIDFFEKAETELQIKEFKTLKELLTYFHETITEGLEAHGVVSDPKFEEIVAHKAWKLFYPNEKIPNLSPRDILRRIPVGAWVKALDNNMPPELLKLVELSGHSGKEAERIFLSNAPVPASWSTQELETNSKTRQLLALYASFLGSAHSGIDGLARTAKRNGLLRDYKFIDGANIPAPSPTKMIPFSGSLIGKELLIFDLQKSTDTTDSAVGKSLIRQIVNHVLGIADEAYFVASEGDAGRLLVENFSEAQITEINALGEVYRSIGMYFRFTVVKLTKEIIEDNNLEAICNNGYMTDLHNALNVEAKVKEGSIKGLSPSNQTLLEERTEALEEQFGLTTNPANQSIKEQREILERTYNQNSSSASRIRAFVPAGYNVHTLSIVLKPNQSPEEAAKAIQKIYKRSLINKEHFKPDKNGNLPFLADENGSPLKASEWSNVTEEALRNLNQGGYGITIKPDGSIVLMMDIVSSSPPEKIQKRINTFLEAELVVVSPPQEYATLDISPNTSDVSTGKEIHHGLTGAYYNSISMKLLAAKAAGKEFNELANQVPDPKSTLPVAAAIARKPNDGRAPDFNAL